MPPNRCGRPPKRKLIEDVDTAPSATRRNVEVNRQLPNRDRPVRNYSHCVTLACEKLSKQQCKYAEQGGELAEAIAESMQNARGQAATFLIIAPRNSGKSAVVDAVIETLVHTKTVPHFVVVHLSGLLHGNLPAALRSIAASVVSFYDDEAILKYDEFKSAQHSTCNLQITAAINRIKDEKKGILFVLDDFERFAVPDSAQPVLYCISNLLQDVDLRGACIAMSTQLDASDGLEKRIKSRFHPREIVLSQPAKVQDIVDILKTGLFLDVPHSNGAGTEQKPSSMLCNHRSDRSTFLDLSYVPEQKKYGLAPCTVDPATVADFNDLVHDFITSEAFRSSLETHLLRDRSMGRVIDAVKDTLSNLFSHGHPSDSDHSAALRCQALSLSSFQTYLGLSCSAIDVIKGLSVLELSLLVALKRIEPSIAAGSSTTFADVYREYESLRVGGLKGHLRGGIDQVYEVADSHVAEKAWERLLDVGLLTHWDNSSLTSPIALTVDSKEIENALREHPLAPEILIKWGTKGITE